MNDLMQRLETYRVEQKITSKGKLAVVLFVSRLAREKGLPLDANELVTDKGQVHGLGKAVVQKILADYGITRVLAEEGGRTNRGNMDTIRQYVRFLNDLHQENLADTEAIEAWWIRQVPEYVSVETAPPFVLNYDEGKSLRSAIRDVLEQAEQRQRDHPGANYASAVLQHLVATTIRLALPNAEIAQSISIADEQPGGSGDFLIGHVSLHVSSSPGEALIRTCKVDLDSGKRPIIITLSRKVPVAEALAEYMGLEERIDIWDAEQFISANLHEINQFEPSRYKASVNNFVTEFNHMVREYETDIRIRFKDR
ncbi:DUF4928 domain-containing protein [Heliobacterium gestii]|uniref:DUF4928 domain-containing protein n=1 Tax=Heliomicrobium gestii TaxID=2699 RepID=A0A845LE33_HELGE|nr:DUF4928 family protein [Heliomicrobium gestii]MBM7865552.1 antitoxin component of RelBE/YafQ-DinJ toxin-antitoxin module [Heliomicrobium gestii]MZP41803.1 DUF4928 domain-containing protein [Heliomicrobium gestii]